MDFDFLRLVYVCTLFLVLQETSQELQMLFSVTLNCQVTMIVMNSCSQLSLSLSLSLSLYLSLYLSLSLLVTTGHVSSSLDSKVEKVTDL